MDADVASFFGISPVVYTCALKTKEKIMSLQVRQWVVEATESCWVQTGVAAGRARTLYWDGGRYAGDRDRINIQERFGVISFKIFRSAHSVFVTFYNFGIWNGKWELNMKNSKK